MEKTILTLGTHSFQCDVMLHLQNRCLLFRKNYVLQSCPSWCAKVWPAFFVYYRNCCIPTSIFFLRYPVEGAPHTSRPPCDSYSEGYRSHRGRVARFKSVWHFFFYTFSISRRHPAHESASMRFGLRCGLHTIREPLQNPDKTVKVVCTTNSMWRWFIAFRETRFVLFCQASSLRNKLIDFLRELKNFVDGFTLFANKFKFCSTWSSFLQRHFVTFV